MINLKNKKAVFKKINTITKLFNLSAYELLAVIYNLKPAMAEANTGVYDSSSSEKLDQLGRICSELGLKMAFSQKKYIINSPRGIFEEVELNSPEDGNLVIGISKDIQTSLSAVAHYRWKMKDSIYGRSFGKLMGYPDCCLDFGDYLCKGHGDSNSNNLGFRNPAVESLKRSKKVAWQLNIFVASALPHYPCHLNCNKSKDYVNGLFEILKIAAPEIYLRHTMMLKNDISLYWSCADKVVFHGHFIKKGNSFADTEAQYNSADFHINSSTFYQANSDSYLNQLEVIKQAIKEGDKIITTPKYFEIRHSKTVLLKINKSHELIPVLLKSDNEK